MKDVKDADADTEMRRMTEYDDPMAMIQSQYGFVTWQKWLQFEAARLEAAGIKTEIRTRKPDHFAALFRARGKQRTEAK